MDRFISNIPLPRRYDLTSVGFDSFGVENKPDGQNMDSKEVLTWRDQLINEVRNATLEETATWIETNEIWLSVGGGTPSVKPTTRENVGAEYRALADQIRKLKEAV